MKTYEYTAIKGEQTPIATFTFDCEDLGSNAINELENLIADNSRGQLQLGYNNTENGKFYTLNPTGKHPEYLGSSDFTDYPKTTITIYKGKPDTVGWLCTEN